MLVEALCERVVDVAGEPFPFVHLARLALLLRQRILGLATSSMRRRRHSFWA